MLPPDIAAASKDVQSHYLKMIAAGQAPRFAEMCALQQAPRTAGTDRTFMEGKYGNCGFDDMPPHQATRIIREAKAAGVDIKGKFYMSGLADKRGHCDPEAWVDSTADIKRVAKKRNLSVKGIVNIEGHEEAPKQNDLNPRIAKELAKKEIAKNPKLSMAEARAVVKEKYTPRWKKKKS
jgi:hypothetical protein